MGALVEYITTERKDFQPMNVNFGIVAGCDKRQKRPWCDGRWMRSPGGNGRWTNGWALSAKYEKTYLTPALPEWLDRSSPNKVRRVTARISGGQ